MNLKGSMIINETFAATAPGVRVEKQWLNGRPFPLYVRKAVVWIGVSFGTVGDIPVQMTHNKTGDIAFVFNRDHYSERGEALEPFDYNPDYIEVLPGEGFDFSAGLHLLGAPAVQLVQAPGAHVSVVIYWTKEP